MIYRTAFDELNSTRLFDGGPIPWTAIDLWADRSELDAFQRFYAYRLVRMLDMAYLRHIQKVQKEANERAKRKQQASKRKATPHGKGRRSR